MPSSAPPSVSVDQADGVFQHYRVLRRPDGRLWELGRGAMGITYKAEDVNLRSVVALKVVNATHLHSEISRSRFRREARAAAALRHPNVASVYHLGNDDQSFFYAMEFIEGETLESFVARHGPTGAARALDIADQIARALVAATRRNLIHRDLKPANVMLVRRDDDDDDDDDAERRPVKLIDFGLAKSTLAAGVDEGGSTGQVTLAGFVGTPLFASPEQLEELELDGRSDIYSLGCTLWFLLTGRPPFTGGLASLFAQHANRPPPLELLEAAGVPAPLRTLLERMLAKSPEDRPGSAAALRREIAACLRAIAPAPVAHAVGKPAPSPLPLPPTDLPATTLPPPTTLGGEEVPAAVVKDTLVLPETLVVPPTLVMPPRRFTPGPGEVLDGVFRLTAWRDDGAGLHALDLRATPPRPARVRLFPDGPAAGWARMEEHLNRLGAAPHPNLLEVLGHGIDRGLCYMATEQLTGFSLVALLRARRGALDPAEALVLVAQAAAAADHARGRNLPPPALNPDALTVHFPDGRPGQTDAFTSLPLAGWPAFLLKAAPPDPEDDAGGDPGKPTWAGAATLLPRTRVLSRDTQSSICGGDNHGPMPALARLFYELLGGRPAALDTRYSPLGGLNEAANDVLRRALRRGFEDGAADPTDYADGAGFVAALGHAFDRAAPPLTRRSGQTTAAPTTAPSPPTEAPPVVLTPLEFALAEPEPAGRTVVEPGDASGPAAPDFFPPALETPPVRPSRSRRPTVQLAGWSAGVVALVALAAVGIGGRMGARRAPAEGVSTRQNVSPVAPRVAVVQPRTLAAALPLAVAVTPPTPAPEHAPPVIATLPPPASAAATPFPLPVETPVASSPTPPESFPPVSETTPPPPRTQTPFLVQPTDPVPIRREAVAKATPTPTRPWNTPQTVAQADPTPRENRKQPVPAPAPRQAAPAKIAPRAAVRTPPPAPAPAARRPARNEGPPPLPGGPF